MALESAPNIKRSNSANCAVPLKSQKFLRPGVFYRRSFSDPDDISKTNAEREIEIHYEKLPPKTPFENAILLPNPCIF